MIQSTIIQSTIIHYITRVYLISCSPSVNLTILDADLLLLELAMEYCESCLSISGSILARLGVVGETCDEVEDTGDTGESLLISLLIAIDGFSLLISLDGWERVAARLGNVGESRRSRSSVGLERVTLRLESVGDSLRSRSSGVLAKTGEFLERLSLGRAPRLLDRGDVGLLLAAFFRRSSIGVVLKGFRQLHEYVKW